MFLIQGIRGFFMALADSVPGVSGGTIAFIMGFYDEFVGSLNSLVSHNSKIEKKRAFWFLFKLGIGWIIGFLVSVSLLSVLFEAYIYQISSVFVGFIIFSIPFIIREEMNTLRQSLKSSFWLVIGVGVVALISFYNPTVGGINISMEQLSLGNGIYVFLVGAIAISAMVLPGISGSTLLLIFGVYAPIINGIKRTLSLDLNYLPILVIFGLGVLTGILLTIRGITYLLKNHRSAMIYFILGLMVGSIIAVFRGPTTLEVPRMAMNLDSFHWLYFLLGGAIIFGLERLKIYLERKEN